MLLVVLASTLTHFNPNIFGGGGFGLVNVPPGHYIPNFVEGLKNIANVMFVLTLTAYYTAAAFLLWKKT